MKKDYKVWPIGKIPKEWQRPELDLLKKKGYKFNDPREVVNIFENKIANYSGSKYAITVDNCTDAIFLCLQYKLYKNELKENDTIIIPKRCYLSVPMAVKLSRLKIKFEDIEWKGVINLEPTNIYDSAVRFTKNMYIKESLQCLSFQIKKRLPIGKGGMILTDDFEAAQWFRQVSFEGRNLLVDQWHDNFKYLGWNMYMTPEDAARGILIFDELPEINDDTGKPINYPDLSNQKVFS